MRRAVAIVGAGPSGFYSAEALLLSGNAIDVHVFDRLPVPYGLVRHGVAPDHQKLKQVTTVFERIAGHPGFAFFGNVAIGESLHVDDLLDAYDAVILATGAESDSLLGIAGEELAGVHAARAFVGWYNGHPDLADATYDFDHEDAVVVGHGNVALDVARMLVAPVDYLKTTDITPAALEQLSTSRIRRVHLVGRRGPAQASFADKELRHLSELDFCELVVDAAALELGIACRDELAAKGSADAVRKVDLFRRFAAGARGAHARSLRFHFLRSPERIEGMGRVERVVLRRNVLDGDPFAQRAVPGETSTTIDCGLLLRSVGYRTLPIAGVPFDARRGLIPSQDARVIDDDGEVVRRLYVAGWAKRGPTGIIGTNRACGVATASAVLEDMASTDGRDASAGDALRSRLDDHRAGRFSFEDWRRIDRIERERGTALGKPRLKFTTRADMLEALGR